jgi:hypothetical protein
MSLIGARSNPRLQRAEPRETRTSRGIVVASAMCAAAEPRRR